MSGFPTELSHLGLLTVAGLLLHGVLWVRNGAFLWRSRGINLRVMLIAEVWLLVTDPIGGHWGAWYFARDKVIGLWLFDVMPIEDCLGMAVVSSAAACATLVFAYSPRRWV